MGDVSPPGKRILVVEDDPTNAKIIGDYLEANGFDTTVASTGEDGVDVFRSTHPDLVIMDLLLPGKNGFEACLDMRAADATTPILLMSAVGAETYAEAYADAGKHTQGYLRKPFTMAELVARVEELL